MDSPCNKNKTAESCRKSSRWVSPLAPLRGQSGVALLMALVSLSLLYFVAMEVSYDSAVDYTVARQQVERIKARYAAKAGMELSLLRVMLYKQAVAALGSSLGGNVNMLDPIWNFPFMWPPTLAAEAAPKMTEVDKSMLKDAAKESLMDAQYTTQISAIGGHLDINDLGSDVKGYAKLMRQQILQIFQTEVQNNEAFARKYAGFRFEEVVNNIADYIDADAESLNGGDESAPYRDVADKEAKLPPNRPLRTLDELHQVAGINEDFYQLLSARVTIYGTKGINVNYAPKEVLMSLDPSMREEAVDKAIARRGDPKQGGPFKNDQDFYGFISGFGVNVKAMQDAKIPLMYDTEFNFKIISTGLSKNVKREITAITYDYPNLAQRLITLLNEQEKQDQGSGGLTEKTPPPVDPGGKTPAADPNAKAKIQTAKGRPTVVYWEEN